VWNNSLSAVGLLIPHPLSRAYNIIVVVSRVCSILFVFVEATENSLTWQWTPRERNHGANKQKGNIKRIILAPNSPKFPDFFTLNESPPLKEGATAKSPSRSRN